MCGIAGVSGRAVDRALLETMARSIEHRGPDDEGIWVGPELGLAFRRLAIVDLESGQQPMRNADGSIVLVYNGEIYDHDILRRELEAKGHRFVTDHSDTEVLVHGYAEWGLGAFERLNGMFACAIWDARQRQLVLARDRYGIKPLYFAELGDGTVVFASEVRAIHASGLVDARPNPQGIAEYFSFQNIWREPTMFEGVRQLDPGTMLVCRDGRVERRRFWEMQFDRSRRESSAELAEIHRDILQRAVRRQIEADVPVKSYLSGGIDSSAITVVAHQFDPTVTAYSCIFDLDGVGGDSHCDERKFSRLVAKEYGLERVEHLLPQDSLVACLDDYVRSIEDLRMGMGYPVYLISQRVAQDAKVVLSGTGGDEYHAGYVARYTILGLLGASAPQDPLSQLKRGLRLTWDKLRGRSAGMPGVPTAPGEIYRNVLNSILKPEQFANAFTPEFLAQIGGYDARAVMDDFIGRCPSDDWHDRVMYVDAKTYLAGLLTLEDKVSMAHSLETRVPLLDNELIDFLLTVPFSALIDDGVGKVLFRESVRPWVPEAIYQKPKMGFGPPDASWYRGRLRSWIEAQLGPWAENDHGVLRPDFVRTILETHFSGSVDQTYWIWTLLNFASWCRVFGFYGAAEQPKLRAVCE